MEIYLDLLIMKQLEKLLDWVFLLWKSECIRHYLNSDHPGHRDTELLFYNLFKRGPMIYYYEQSVINKNFVKDLEQKYPGIKYIQLFVNNAHLSDPGFECWNQAHFLILLKRQGLMIEYDSRGTYSVYFTSQYKDIELRVILGLLNKHKKVDWPWSYQHLRLN